MDELDNKAKGEIEGALQTEALSDTQKSQVSEMIITAVKAALGNTDERMTQIDQKIVDLNKRHGNLTESVDDLARGAKAVNKRLAGNNGSARRAMIFGNVKLTGGCSCAFPEYLRTMCDCMKALQNAITAARSAGAEVLPPYSNCPKCPWVIQPRVYSTDPRLRKSEVTSEWEAACEKCRAVFVLGILG